jgi:AcrR family transcriptional regulator
MSGTKAQSERPAAEAKRQRLLDGAMAVVLRYGYARTTMDDLAKEAGISRPALYLHFRNKGEIYQALAGSMMAKAIEAARAALNGGGPVEARVFQAVKTGILDPMDFLMATAHGAELLDMKHAMAAAAIKNWRAEKAAIIAAALDGSGVAQAKGMSGAQLADILLDGIEGLKLRAKTSQEREEGARALVRLVAG